MSRLYRQRLAALDVDLHSRPQYSHFAMAARLPLGRMKETIRHTGRLPSGLFLRHSEQWIVSTKTARSLPVPFPRKNLETPLYH